MSNAAQAHFTSPAVQVCVTLPDQILRHEISDEELDMICQSRKDFVFEMVWSSIGTVTGAAPGALSTLWKMFVLKSTAPMDIADFAQVVLFFCGIVLASGMIFVANVRGTKTDDLVAKIRERTNRRLS